VALEPESGDELVVATPERVTFDYQLAGPGSRFLAQLVDFPLQLVALAIVIAAALLFAALTHENTLALALGVVMAFLVVWGYYVVSEAVWSGRTLGKYAFGLRVVGDRGEPLRASQAVIRNLIRIVDFLPWLYGLGIAVLFLNGRGKRLGDLAAGTVVVRERAPVSLAQLIARVPAQPSTMAPPVGRQRPESPLVRSLDADLRRFVAAYADRRPWLDPWRRNGLALRVEPLLRRYVPDLVASYGALTTLERLADLELETRV
jgi:uncharacterized RDD family membrane protein YckC